jgi:tRNA modification GTPase
MEFIQQHYQPGETIAAIATPPGEGGVAIVRISGKEAFEVAERVFSRSVKSFRSHTAHYGQIRNAQDERVDDVLILPMRAPKSYTGEDTVEIFCHGGSLITRRVLEVVLAAGARAAMPGEFTFKAFVNGRMDLAQAEAVQELIGAKNERALDAAERQLEGSLSKKVLDYQERLTLIAAILEAWVDFPEEGLEFASMEEIVAKLSDIRNDIQKLLDTFHDGKILHDGLSLCLVGAPNVGKSSLMNALLDKERAIVSPIPGTTRDVVEDEMRLSGLNFRILDTAGIRETVEMIEQEGIRRSRRAMEQADLVLVVMEAQNGFWPYLEEVPRHKAVLAWNKCDLPHPNLPDHGFAHTAAVSALKRTGLTALKEEIEKVIWKKGPPSKEEIVVTNVRHKEALKEASYAITQTIEGLQKGVSPEFLTLDVRTSLQALGKILGTNVSEDILDSIFSTFCIGK